MEKIIMKKNLDEYCIENIIPANLTIELNTTCNLECIHCYIPEHNNIGLSLKKIKELIDDARELGVFNITLTGGEIFLRKDIIDIIKYIRAKHLRVDLISNATLLNQEIVSILADLNLSKFGVSVYSLDKDIHDYITGHDGSLKDTLKGIELLKRYNIPVIIKTPVMNINFESIESIKDYCVDNNFEDEFTCSITSKTDGDHTPREYELNNFQLKKFTKKTTTIGELIELVRPINLDENPCEYCKSNIYVNSFGEVFPCNSFLVKVGDLKENRLSDIWSKSEELKKLQNIKKSDTKDCIDCETSSFCNRCPGISLSEEGSMYKCSLMDKKETIFRKEIFMEYFGLK